MSNQISTVAPAVDIIIPVYGERSEVLSATLSACADQTYPVGTIFVVDDGSPEPVSLSDGAQSSPRISLLRLPQNQGISAARNAAIALSNATFIACINTEVLPAPDWLDTCLQYLLSQPRVGVCYTRTVPQTPDPLLTRWRMRFQEPACPEQSGPTPFAHGHAVLFRKEALDAVGGYDVRFRRHHEDSDISQRMMTAGWESHYVAGSRCVSIQQDSLNALAIKQLRDSGWYSPQESSLFRLYLHLSKWTFIRAARNLLKGRLYFLPVDVAIWARALWFATSFTLRS
jgi:GT2 family glycosyltransferase